MAPKAHFSYIITANCYFKSNSFEEEEAIIRYEKNDINFFRLYSFLLTIFLLVNLKKNSVMSWLFSKAFRYFSTEEEKIKMLNKFNNFLKLGWFVLLLRKVLKRSASNFVKCTKCLNQIFITDGKARFFAYVEKQNLHLFNTVWMILQK